MPRRDAGRRRPPHLSAEQRAALRDEYAEGWDSLADLAAKYGVTAKRVAYYVRGVTRTDPYECAGIHPERAAVRDLLAANRARPEDVRGWAYRTGRACHYGTPPRAIVKDYLLEHRRLTARLASAWAKDGA